MKAKLVVDNREIEVEISEEELDRLSSKREKKTGYERVEFGYTHYFGEICSTLGGQMKNVMKKAMINFMKVRTTILQET